MYRLHVRHVANIYIYIYIYIIIYLDIVPDVPDTSGESKNNIGPAQKVCPKVYVLHSDIPLYTFPPVAVFLLSLENTEPELSQAFTRNQYTCTHDSGVYISTKWNFFGLLH